MSEASKIIQTKVDNEFNRKVNDLTEEVTDKIIKQRHHFRGYDSSEYLLKCDFEQLFHEHSTVSQYGSPPTLKLKALIQALIIRKVEESGKEKIAKSLVAKIEQFFEEGDTNN